MLNRFDRHVLELVRDNIEPRGKPVKHVRIVIRTDYLLREMRCGGIGGGVQEAEPESERVTSEREHPAELAGAEHPDVHRSSRGSG